MIDFIENLFVKFLRIILYVLFKVFDKLEEDN